MKVTALIPDELVDEVKTLSHGKNITDSLIIVMKEWVALKRLKELNRQVAESPLEFENGFSAEQVRELSRRRG